MKGSVLGKDPAVSWVFNDWQGGTMTLTRFQKGCYMDLLTAQFNNGHLSLDEIKTVLGGDFGPSWPILQKKFKQDSMGMFYNDRLEFEINKRKKYNKSRRDNLSSEGDLSPHMGNGNGIENEIEIRKLEFKLKIFNEENIQNYSDVLLTEFFEYWAESNGKKMRFEMQSVFDIGRRLGTWKRNGEKFSDHKNKSKLEITQEQYHKDREKLGLA